MSGTFRQITLKATIGWHLSPCWPKCLSRNNRSIGSRGENPDAWQAARAYEERMVQHFGLVEGAFPRFNLMLLGLGSDAHTASLFPGTDVLTEQRRIVAAPWVEKLRAFRITLTPPAFSAAENVIFLVSGQDKTEAVKAVLRGEFQPGRFPAQLIRPRDGSLTWLIDRAAARHLDA
jgi:6-phosphogluconolactonase